MGNILTDSVEKRDVSPASAHPIVFSGEIGFKCVCVVACSIGELS